MERKICNERNGNEGLLRRVAGTPLGARLPLALALIVLPIITMALGRSYVVYLYSLVMVYVIVTLGLNILTGYTGQISIGHAGFMAVAAYTSAILTGRFGVPFMLALVIASLFAAVLGLGLGMPALRLHGHYLAIATLGFGVAVGQLSASWDKLTGGYQGMKAPVVAILGYRFDTDLKYYYLVLVLTWLLVEAARNMLRSRPGRALMAVRDSEVAAQAMGINLAKYKVTSFAVSAFYAGVAGVLHAHLTRYVSPYDFNMGVSMTLLSAIVVGGLGSVPGSILGAVFMTILPHVFSRVKNLPLILAGLSLILVVLFLPYGLVSLPWRIKGAASGARARRATKSGNA